MKILKVESSIDKHWNMGVALVRKDGSSMSVEKHQGTFIAYCSPEVRIMHPKLESRTAGFKALDGSPMDKLTFYPMSWNDWLDILKDDTILESDIKQEWRYLLQNSVEFDHGHKIMYLDIETKDCIDSDNAPEPVLSVVTLVDGEYLKFIWHPTYKSSDPKVVVFKSELRMLNAIVSYFERTMPTLFAGWNVNFDMAYLINRCRMHEVDVRPISCMNEVFVRRSGVAVVKGHEVFDLLRAVKKITYNRLRSYSLKNVSKSFGDTEKIKRWPSVAKMWEKDPDFLLEYNTRDVELLPLIEKEYRVLDYFYALQDLVGLPLSELYNNSMIIDFSLLKAFSKEFAFPNVPFTMRSEYEGAKVLDPGTGLFKNVAVLDFKSLYPSIIMSYNVSPETLSADGEIDIDGIKFKKEPLGIFPRLIESFWDERFKIKKQMADPTISESDKRALNNRQTAIKTVMNSFYGVTAFPGFRLYDYRVAESITYLGRKLLGKAKSIAEKHGYQVVYGDTDSIFVEVGGDDTEKAIEQGAKISELINTELAAEIKAITGIKPKVEMEFEKLFSSIVFIGVKKKYAGLLAYKDGKYLDPYKLHVTGFEIIKKDTPPKAKKILSEAFIRVLNLEPLSDIEKWLQSEVVALNLEITDACCLNLEMARPYEEYVNLPMHARASMYSANNLGITFEPGDKVNVMYVKKVPAGMPYTDVVAYKDDAEKLSGFEIDYDTWIEKSLYKKLVPLFNALGKRDFSLDKHQTKLGMWC